MLLFDCIRLEKLLQVMFMKKKDNSQLITSETELDGNMEHENQFETLIHKKI
jgi:hypothetical protein